MASLVGQDGKTRPTKRKLVQPGMDIVTVKARSKSSQKRLMVREREREFTVSVCGHGVGGLLCSGDQLSGAMVSTH